MSARRILQFRAWPLIDTDFSRMFTHSYAAFMGLARWHLLFGSEFRALALRNKWAPIASAEVISYRKSVRAWQRFALETRVVFWDEARFYIEHVFVSNDVVCMRALVEGLVRGPLGVFHPNDVFGNTGFAGRPPAISSEQVEEIECLRKLSSARINPSLGS